LDIGRGFTTELVLHADPTLLLMHDSSLPGNGQLRNQFLQLGRRLRAQRLAMEFGQLLELDRTGALPLAGLKLKALLAMEEEEKWPALCMLSMVWSTKWDQNRVKQTKNSARNSMRTGGECETVGRRRGIGRLGWEIYAGIGGWRQGQGGWQRANGGGGERSERGSPGGAMDHAFSAQRSVKFKKRAGNCCWVLLGTNAGNWAMGIVFYQYGWFQQHCVTSSSRPQHGGGQRKARAHTDCWNWILNKEQSGKRANEVRLVLPLMTKTRGEGDCMWLKGKEPFDGFWRLKACRWRGHGSHSGDKIFLLSDDGNNQKNG
jgi:hypothetical protein